MRTGHAAAAMGIELTLKTSAQGLEVDSAGRAAARPHRLGAEAAATEQGAWAATSEKRSAQYLDSLSFQGGRVVGHAGALPACLNRHLSLTWLAPGHPLSFQGGRVVGHAGAPPWLPACLIRHLSLHRPAPGLTLIPGRPHRRPRRCALELCGSLPA